MTNFKIKQIQVYILKDALTNDIDVDSCSGVSIVGIREVK